MQYYLVLHAMTAFVRAVSCVVSTVTSHVYALYYVVVFVIITYLSGVTNREI
jgi:hypothetical protein